MHMMENAADIVLRGKRAFGVHNIGIYEFRQIAEYGNDNTWNCVLVECTANNKLRLKTFHNVCVESD